MDYGALDRAIRGNATADVLGYVTAALTAVVTGLHALRAVHHPLGFDCLPVHRDGWEGICVHAWPARRRPPNLTTSPFHCHSWDLLSYVLFGVVGNQRLEVTEGSTFAVFDVHTTPAGDEIVTTQARVDVKAEAPEYWTQGEFYQLPAGSYHTSTIAGEDAAATVVLGRRLPDQHDYTLGALDTPSHRVDRALRTIEETRSLAADILGRLGEAPVAVGRRSLAATLSS